MAHLYLLIFPSPSNPTTKNCRLFTRLNGGSSFVSGSGNPSSSPVSVNKDKKGAVSLGNGSSNNNNPPRCQVDGCKVDLSDVKAYYSRHKVCAMHSKSPKVVVSGNEQRFCQQCSRLHMWCSFLYESPRLQNACIAEVVA